MLREHKGVAQKKSDPGSRRWFTDGDMDLIVWYAGSGEIIGFQLCYDREPKPRAFTFYEGRMQHAGVDWGDGPGVLNKGTPILVADGQPPIERVVEEFKKRSGLIDKHLVAMVVEKISGFKTKKKTK